MLRLKSQAVGQNPMTSNIVNQAGIEVLTPATGAQLVRASGTNFLIGQPPEVLKGLLRAQIDQIHALVLTDSRASDGSLLHNVEFMLYHFLFVSEGLKRGEKLALIGPSPLIADIKRLLKITLLGPDPEQLEAWQTESNQAAEWLDVSIATALKGQDGKPLTVDDLVSSHPFEANQVAFNGVTISHVDRDRYRFCADEQAREVIIDADSITPAYPLHLDYLAGRLNKFSVEVLGGASGFSPNEPCTGLALCHNGDYVLIDSIPFLDVHLRARGIAKSQISACFLTHIHDDHCSMLPLMISPHRVEIITATEIFNMAMEKLALSLGWEESAVREHFIHLPTDPNLPINYYGMLIEPHYTVHSIPTMGATFTSNIEGTDKRICIVGDNHSLEAIESLTESGEVQPRTRDRIAALYREPFNLLIADGGAGVLHGNPAEFVDAPSERVVFVHVDELPESFRATFSVASAGKSYSVIPGDDSLYLSLIHHYLNQWMGDSVPDKWIRSLIAGAKLEHYNRDDVILVQGDASNNKVYLLLTGYCDVVHQSDDQWRTIAELQAGDLMGEMAAITQVAERNASVIASTPVTIAAFSDEIFSSLNSDSAFKDGLLKRWQIRPLLNSLPYFSSLTSVVIEKLSRLAKVRLLPVGEQLTNLESTWWILSEGEVTVNNLVVDQGNWGWRPFEPNTNETVICHRDARFICFDRDALEALRLETPQLNYALRMAFSNGT